MIQKKPTNSLIGEHQAVTRAFEGFKTEQLFIISNMRVQTKFYTQPMGDFIYHGIFILLLYILLLLLLLLFPS